MSTDPGPLEYKPPSCPPAVEHNFRIDITETDMLHVRQQVYRDLITFFAIMQLVWEDGQWQHVARIDCCHSTIHRHQMTREGKDIYSRLVITAIPPDGGERWSVVDAGYRDALGVLYEEWEDNVRRWRDGR